MKMMGGLITKIKTKFSNYGIKYDDLIVENTGTHCLYCYEDFVNDCKCIKPGDWVKNAHIKNNLLTKEKAIKEKRNKKLNEILDLK